MADPAPALLALSPPRHRPGWWGMVCLIATEASLFAYLLFSVLFIAVQRGGDWFAESRPPLMLAGPNTLLLLASSAVVWWGERGGRAGRNGREALGYALAAAMGAAFAAVQMVEWQRKSFSPQSSSFGSLYFIVTGFHMAHVAVGVIMLAAVALWSALGTLPRDRQQSPSNTALYWHFVDAVWLCVFTTFYLLPYVWN